MFFGFHTPADPRWAGTQYRSAIFVHTPEQRKLAEDAVQSQGSIGKYVAIEDASDFYRAEEYHQDFIGKQGVSSSPISSFPSQKYPVSIRLVHPQGMA